MAFTSGTTNGFSLGATKRATVALNPATSLVSGNNWFNGVDVSTQYLIYSDTFSQGQAPITTARPTAWTTPNLTDASLLALINTLPDRVGQAPYTDINVALQWLQNSEKYFLIKNGYEDIVTDGLVLNLDAGWYNSYPGSGTVWTDLSGQGNNATLVNGPSFSTNGQGSLNFDGTDDLASLGNFFTYQTFTIGLWVKPDGSQTTYADIIDNNHRGNQNWVLQQNVANLNQYEFAVFGSAGQTSLSGLFTLTTDEWVYLTFTFDGTNLRSYRNGIQFSTGAALGTTVYYNDQNFYLGYWGGGGRNWNGEYGIVHSYNRALSNDEVFQNYNAQKARYGFGGQSLFSGVTQYFDFSKQSSYPGTGTNLNDVSGNGYNGSISNGSFTTIDGVRCWNCSTTGWILTDNDFVFGNNYTIFIWARAISDSQAESWRTLLRTIDDDHPLIIQENTDLLGYYDNNSAGFVSYGLTLNGVGLSNVWGLYTLVGSGGSTQKLYINDGTTNATVNYNVSGEAQDAWGNVGGGSQPFGYVSNMVVYNNQAFTQSQVAQYFNATKQYYGYTVNNIPSNGLVMNLDAGNPISYPGSGTVWYDLTGYGNNVNLTNGPSFVPVTNGGYFSNDVDSYFEGSGNSTIPTGNSSYTMLVWARQTSGYGWGGNNGLISIGGYYTINQSNALRTLNNAVGNFHHYWWANDLSLESNAAGVALDTWFLVAASFDGTTRRIWVNGVSRTSDTPTGHNVTSTTIQISKTVANEYQIGDIAVARIYNRALTSEEMLTTFNTEKSRFGL
jgi:hypothetical protein